VVVLICATTTYAQPATQPRPPISDWLQYVPADAQLYVEFRNLTRIREQLRELKIWTAVKTLSERAEPTPASQAWQKQQQILGMSQEDAVTQVLGFRTAVIARDPWGWKQGLVMAQLPPRTVGELLRKWKARAVARRGMVQEYALGIDQAIRLARRGHLLLFGPAQAPDPLWDETVALLAGEPGVALSELDEVGGLLARVPRSCDGLIVVNRPAAGPGTALPETPVTLIAAMRFEKTRLEIDAYWPGGGPASATAAHHSLLERLPPDALICWSGAFDGGAWLQSVETGPAGAFWRKGLALARILPGGPTLDEPSLARLGPEVVVALHREPGAPDAGYQAPVLSLFVDAREPPHAADEVGRLISLLAMYINTQLVRSGSGVSPIQIEQTEIGDATIHRLPLGEAMAAYTSCPFLKRLELVWTQTGEHLVVSTSQSLVRAFVAPPATAPATRPAATRPSRDLFPPRDARAPAQWMYVRGGAIARMLQTWLDYARKSAPDALKPEWWTQRRRARARESERMGLTVRSIEQDGPAAEVLEVEADSPAAGVLVPGDIIVAVEDRGLSADGPARQVADAFRNRVSDDSFTVDFLRAGRRLRQVIAIDAVSPRPQVAFNPVSAIRPLISVGRRIALVTASMEPAQDATHARVTIRWQPPEPERPRPAPGR